MSALNRLFGGRSDFQAIIEELNRPIHNLNEIPRRVQLCEQALSLLPRRQDPSLWAALQSVLGESLRDNLVGNRTDNLERAIAAFEAALLVRTRQAFPQDWAATQHNLGVVYSERVAGDPADNLERAIAAYEAALQVHTRQAFPEAWAAKQHNLGNVYRQRIAEDRANNLERAIVACEAALQIETRQASPEAWAGAQNNLGAAYSERIAGDRADNLEHAIEAFEAALQVRTRQAFPQDWASTQRNLGIAYTNRIDGDRADNLERAIMAFEAALQVFTWQAFPELWAGTQHNLGNVYRLRIRGDRADNLERAIAACEAALQVYDQQTSPELWAGAQNNLGAAYSERIAEDRTDNLARAIAAYEAALQVYPRQVFPVDYRRTLLNLGDLHFEEQQWQSAYTVYREAMTVGTALFAMASVEEARQAELAEGKQLYVRMACCLLKLGQPAEALIQLEAGKARLLAEALALGDAHLARLNPAQQADIQAHRAAIRALEAEYRLPVSEPRRRELIAALGKTRGDLARQIEAIRTEYPDFMPEGLDLPGILALIPTGGALVAPLFTSQGSAIFVVPHGVQTVTEAYVLSLDDFKEDDLAALLVGSEENPGWLREYIGFLQGSALAGWQAAIIRVTGQLWEKVVAPLHTRLQELNVQQVILMPARGLQLLPLHAAWREIDGKKRAFIDDYEVVYAPSAYALEVSRHRAAQRNGTSALVAGINYYADPQVIPLMNAAAEAQAVGALLGADPLLDAAATKTAIVTHAAGCATLHLSCHGYFDWGNPMASGLILHDDLLTLAEIIGKLNLNVCRLVTLSACETGITDVRQSPDEYVGLPAGFLQAGAPAVVSSLWTVDDHSTALLMERFYNNYLEQGMSLPAALREAQLWLRDEKGYDNPYFWAAFTFSGA